MPTGCQPEQPQPPRGAGRTGGPGRRACWATCRSSSCRNWACLSSRATDVTWNAYRRSLTKSKRRAKSTTSRDSSGDAGAHQQRVDDDARHVDLHGSVSAATRIAEHHGAGQTQCDPAGRPQGEHRDGGQLDQEAGSARGAREPDQSLPAAAHVGRQCGNVHPQLLRCGRRHDRGHWSASAADGPRARAARHRHRRLPQQLAHRAGQSARP